MMTEYYTSTQHQKDLKSFIIYFVVEKVHNAAFMGVWLLEKITIFRRLEKLSIHLKCSCRAGTYWENISITDNKRQISQHSNITRQWSGSIPVNTMMRLSWLFFRTTVTLTTTTVNARTESALVLQIQWSTDEERLTKLTNMQSCPLVLCIEWPRASPVHIKAISLSAFLLSNIISMRGRSKKCIQTAQDFEVFPPNPSAWFVQSPLLSFLSVWKHITET